MTIFGYHITEWSVLLGTIATIFTLIGFLIRWIAKKAKRFTEDVLGEFNDKTIQPLMKSIDGLSNSLEKETTWIHDRHDEVVKHLKSHDERLNRHRKTLNEHDTKLTRHEIYLRKEGKNNE